MKRAYADRMGLAHKSFIREILKVTGDPEIISFAGGLPNPSLFPVSELAMAAKHVFAEGGEEALQYSTTEGYLPLREYIAKRYRDKGVKVSPEEIMITNGSQQGLDLIAKVFLNKGDGVLLERPTYLAAIQSFGLFEPTFRSITLEEDGIVTADLEKAFQEDDYKLFYSVPNFQNPIGITYSRNKRREVSDIISDSDIVLVEDDPYGELRFMGEDVPSFGTFLGESAILLGSFSKILAPGMRLGWICAPEEIMEKLIVAKQASDLHTNYLSQMIAHQYLMENDLDAHIAKIRAAYGAQRDSMVKMMEEVFPPEIAFTRPEGGMFLWASLPDGISTLELFQRAIEEKVAFVPGQAFFADGGGSSTMRLNYSNCDEEKIQEGITRLGKVIKEAM